MKPPETPLALGGVTGGHGYIREHLEQVAAQTMKATQTRKGAKARSTLEVVRNPGPDALSDVNRTWQRTDAPRHNWTVHDPEHGGAVAERWARGGVFEPDTQGTIMSGMRKREPGADGLTVAPYRHSATPELTMPSGAMEGKVQSKDWRRVTMVNDHEAARTLALRGEPTNQGRAGPVVDRSGTIQLGSGQSPHERRMQPYDLRTPKSGRDWVGNMGGSQGGSTSGLRKISGRNVAEKGSPTRRLQDKALENMFKDINHETMSRKKERHGEEVAFHMSKARTSAKPAFSPNPNNPNPILNPHIGMRSHQNALNPTQTLMTCV